MNRIVAVIRIKSHIVLSVCALALLGCGVIIAADDTPLEQFSASDIPTGHYTLDKSHSTVIFKLSHIGFSFYTGSFSHFDATLDIDPERLESAKLTATIDIDSLSIPEPPEGFIAELLGPEWLNAGQFPQMVFR